jgi:hypothetical protein
MSTSVFAFPISIEQLATVIRHMTSADRPRLLDLVPELRQEATRVPPCTPDEAQAAIECVREKVTQALAGQPLAPDEPFVEDLTLGQYLNLPDEARARLWEAWADGDPHNLEEREVRSDAVPAR